MVLKYGADKMKGRAMPIVVGSQNPAPVSCFWTSLDMPLECRMKYRNKKRNDVGPRAENRKMKSQNKTSRTAGGRRQWSGSMRLNPLETAGRGGDRAVSLCHTGGGAVLA